MITHSIIKKSQLESKTRLDAEYYQPEYLEVQERIKKLKTFVLGEISFITDGQHGYFKLDENSEIRQITAQHIIDGFIDKTNADRLSKETHEKNLRASLKENDIVLSTVGTVGNAGVVTKEIPPANLDQNVARINLKIKDLDPWYLVAFLNSKYGQLQINRNITGQVQQRLSLETLRHLEIPIISEQENAGNLLKTSYKALTSSKLLYSQAEDLLLAELGLKEFKSKEELSYIVNLSNVKSAHRADAEYYQPKYEKIIEKIKKQNVKLLGDLVSLRKGFEPGSDEYQNKGKLFIRVSNISNHGLIDKDQKYLGIELYQRLRKDFEPKIGEILLTKDATPGIAYVLKESIEGIIAGGILRLVIREDIEAEYLALCINSVIGQMQNERDAGGSVIVHWKPEQIKKLQVPILTKSTQQKIADMVHQSHQASKKAKEFLEKAKREVEEFIEKK